MKRETHKKLSDYFVKESPLSTLTLHELCRETILGFSFWSILLGLPAMIWFYPLNELDVTGYEVFICFLFSPCILILPGAKKLLGNRFSMTILRLGCIIGLSSFQSTSTLSRLIILSVGGACSMLVLTFTLWHGNQRIRSMSVWGMVLALFAVMSSRVWYTSFLATWWSNSANNAVVAMVTIATVDKFFSGGDHYVIPCEPVAKRTTSSFWAIVFGISFGSLLYITHALFTETSILSRWTVQGYPNTGPAPFPDGFLVLVCFWLGVTMLSDCVNAISSSSWWVCGCVGLYTLYYNVGWTAYIGGLIFCVYISSLWPIMLDHLTACRPGYVALATCTLTYICEVLFSVWCTAYNFVPGGVYTRERTDLLLIFVMITLGIVMFSNDKLSYKKSESAFAFLGRNRLPNKRTLFVFLLILIYGILGYSSRHGKQYKYSEEKMKRNHFRAAIWTYHFGYDNRGWPSLERAAEMLNNTDADIITLLESDASKPYLGNNDLGAWLGERLGMYVDFGVSTKDHTWGNLLLSKYPIISSKHHMLPSPHGELAPAITAVINISSHPTTFVVTHMGNDRDDIDRKLQAEFLTNELKNRTTPGAVFLGYVTSKPGSRDYRKLATVVKDIDKSDKDRWCEYIMYTGLRRLGYARVSNGGLSDTELQMATFEHIYPKKTSSKDNQQPKDYNKRTHDPSKVPNKEHLFSNKFGAFFPGHQWDSRSHTYHMSTPTYFLP